MKTIFFNKYVFYPLLILIASTSFLFSPQPHSSKNYLQEYIVINEYMGFQINMDANLYCEAAINPASILDKNHIRQSRPMYIFLGSIFYYPVSLFFDFINFNNFQYTSTFSDSSNEIQSKQIRVQEKLPAYIGFIIINAIILLISLLIFHNLLTKSNISKNIIILSSFILVYNFSVKIFFWTSVHCLLSILAPIYSIYLLLKLQKNNEPITQYKIFILSFLNGILLLLYGIFALILPVIIIGYYLNYLYSNNKFSLWNLTTVPIYFLLPTFLWIFTLEQFFYGYYNHEFVYGNDFIWILQALQQGIFVFLNKLSLNILLFSKTLLAPTILLIPIAILFFVKKINFSNFNSNIIFASIVVFLLFFFFLFSSGEYDIRLSISLVPPLLIILAKGMENVKLSFLHYNFFRLFIIGWIIYHVASYGPFGPLQ